MYTESRYTPKPQCIKNPENFFKRTHERDQVMYPFTLEVRDDDGVHYGTFQCVSEDQAEHLFFDLQDSMGVTSSKLNGQPFI